MKEGRIRPSLAEAPSNPPAGSSGFNEGGSNSTLVGRTHCMSCWIQPCFNEGGSNSTLVASGFDHPGGLFNPLQ